MPLDLLLVSGLAAGVIAWRTRQPDLRFIATFAAVATLLLALVNWDLW
jgi:CHASE2 domain-containing sensor protein